MRDKDLNTLIIDLAALLDKHGSDSFIRLAEYLKNPELKDALPVILEDIAVARPKKRRKTTLTNAERVENKFKKIRLDLTVLAEKEPDKSAVLSEYFEGLIQKKYLPTGKQVHSLFVDLSGFETKYRTRPDSIVLLINALKEMKFEDMKRALDLKISTNDKNSDRSLEGWSEVILKKTK